MQHSVSAVLFLSPFPLLLISSDSFHNANSLGASTIISLETAAEKIEVVPLWWIEPHSGPANIKSPADARWKGQF